MQKLASSDTASTTQTAEINTLKQEVSGNCCVRPWICQVLIKMYAERYKLFASVNPSVDNSTLNGSQIPIIICFIHI